MKINFLVLSAFVFLLLIACKEEENNPEFINQLQYGDSLYSFNDAVLDDFGSVNLVDYFSSENHTHFEYDIDLSNGTFEWNEEYELYRLNGATMYMKLALISKGSDEFHTGKFSWANAFVEIPDHSFFIGEFYIDSDGDGEIDVDFDNYFEFTGGTVEVTGSGTDLSLKFNIALDNGETIKGAYSKDYKYQDKSDWND